MGAELTDKLGVVKGFNGFVSGLFISALLSLLVVLVYYLHSVVLVLSDRNNHFVHPLFNRDAAGKSRAVFLSIST